MRTRVKICGLKSVQDVRAAAEAGADALGFVFYESSPRAVTVSQATDLVKHVPSLVTSVGLFVNASSAFIEDVLAHVPLSLLQFHGDESPAFCAQFGVPYIKAVRMKAGVDLHALRDAYCHARGLMVDAYRAGVPGGTGTVFDWQLLPHDMAGEVILAGGLNARNVAVAIEQVSPWAVDVSGGVESHKGVKDHAKIAQFMQAVKATY